MRRPRADGSAADPVVAHLRTTSTPKPGVALPAGGTSPRGPLSVIVLLYKSLFWDDPRSGSILFLFVVFSGSCNSCSIFNKGLQSEVAEKTKRRSVD